MGLLPAAAGLGTLQFANLTTSDNQPGVLPSLFLLCVVLFLLQAQEKVCLLLDTLKAVWVVEEQNGA